MKCPKCGNKMEEVIYGEFSCSNCKKNNNNDDKKQMFCSKCNQEIPNDSDFCPYCSTNLRDKMHEVSNTKKIKIKNVIKANKLLVIVCLLIIVPILLAIIITLSLDDSGIFNNNNNYNNSSAKVEYGSPIYKNTKYGEDVVKSFYNTKGYGRWSGGVGKITSIKSSTFLESDNYGRYAFKVTFEYNPYYLKTGTIDTTLLSTKTVIAIYLLNLDNPSGLYVGAQNIISTTLDWETAKGFKDLCGGAWNTPITLNFTD